MLLHDLAERGIRDARVLAAFGAVPREAFVATAEIDQAYADMPLPIGCGQTISQPYVVALTAQAMELGAGAHVLEVGTGSGYAAAILGRLARRVDTVERIAGLAAAAEATLARLGVANVFVHRGDGSLGWLAGAPFDAIAVAAAARLVPPALLAQLAVGGRLVMPVGTADDQQLVRITRTNAGYTQDELGVVRFVPLIGAEGWARDPRFGP